MGASKRICEMIIQSFDRKIRDGKASEILPLHVHIENEGEEPADAKCRDAVPATEFVAVRFGNVLGSNGSVVPRFKEQIAKGGPVTVTHPDIIRYFMTIPEAVSLVLQAGTYANGGEIFVLDMGEPMKIDTLARNLIRLSGLIPDVDVKIAYTGLRPGEKLYEELLISEEGIQKTENDLIYIAKPMEFDSEYLFEKINYTKEIIEDASPVEIVDIIKELVPTFYPNNDNYRDKKEKLEEAKV
jgi:FlaA1/EpsC-like NDP-sugar epimerase